MKPQVALPLLASLSVVCICLSACNRAPVMINIDQQVPLGLQPEPMSHDAFPGVLLGRVSVVLWQELCPVEVGEGRLCRVETGQAESFVAPPDLDMRQVVNFYQQQLGDERWQLRRYSMVDTGVAHDCAVWRWEKQTLQACWTSEPVEWELLSRDASKQAPTREKLRLILVYATPRPA